jgi:hypothetical protein
MILFTGNNSCLSRGSGKERVEGLLFDYQAVLGKSFLRQRYPFLRSEAGCLPPLRNAGWFH